MRSLEDLERAFERGLNAWESGKVRTEMCPGGQAENASHNGQPETALALIGRKAGE